jgi:hypothetical protein
MFKILVLEYLSKGQLIEWDENSLKFYRPPSMNTNDISQ